MCKAHRLLYHSILGLREIKKKKHRDKLAEHRASLGTVAKGFRQFLMLQARRATPRARLQCKTLHLSAN